MCAQASEKAVSKQSLPQPPQTLAQDNAIPRIELEAYPFHCQVFGQEHKESILVLHGGPGADFRYLLPLKALASNYRVIFYDQRGSGLSPRTSGKQLHLLQYLKDLDAFVGHFGQQGPLYLLGHSWGAHLALQYVARHSDKVQGLLLAEPYIPSGSLSLKMGLHNIRNGISGKFVKALQESLQLSHTDPLARQDYFFGYLLQKSNPGYNCPGNNPQLPFWRASARAFTHLSFSLHTKLNEIALRGINFPPDKILILAGECNQLLNEAYHRAIQRKLRYPQLSLIPDAGHYLFTDNAAACFMEIEQFIREIKPIEI